MRELDDTEIHKLARQYLQYTDGDSEVYGTLAFARAIIRAASAAPAEGRESMTEEVVERQYREGIHIGSGLPRATCPCGLCAKHRFGFNRATAPADGREATGELSAFAEIPEGWMLVLREHVEEIEAHMNPDLVEDYRGCGLYDDAATRANFNACNSALEDIRSAVESIRNDFAPALLPARVATAPTMSEAERPTHCTWTYEDDNETVVWQTACGETFVFCNDDGPLGNSMKWCCYCGGKMTENRAAAKGESK